MWFYGWEPLMVSNHPAKFGNHRHCGSGDIMFLVAEEQNSRCSRFNPPLLFNPLYCLFLKNLVWKHTAHHIINSDPGHTRSKQHLDKTSKITFTSPSKNTAEKEKTKTLAITKRYALKAQPQKLEWQLQSFLR